MRGADGRVLFGDILEPAARSAVLDTLDREWTRVEQASKSECAWLGYELSPAFPDQWPSTDRRVSAYAFAYGFRPGLMDASDTAAPWARIRLAVGGGEPQVDLLDGAGGGLRALTPQGLRPLEATEIEAYEQEPYVEQHLFEE